MTRFTLASLPFTALLLLSACNSSDNTVTTPPPAPPAPPVEPPPIVADEALLLDFTLPLSELSVEDDILVGATLNEERGEFVLLGAQGMLVYLSPEGSVTAQAEIEGPSTFTGIEFIGDQQYVVSTNDAKILLLEEQDLTLQELATLDFTFDAVAFDETTASAIVVDDGTPSSIVSVTMSGELSSVPLESPLDDNSVTGLTLWEDVLLIASISENEEESLIVGSGLNGEIGPVWSIPSNQTSSLVLLDPEAPEILTTNSDAGQSVTLFEAPSPPSIPSDTAVTLLETRDLDFDQPSGLDVDASTSELYYVTDFGEVRQGTGDGENQRLFEIDVMQGSFEAIVYQPQSETIALMMSDEATEENRIVTFDRQGNLVLDLAVAITEESHLFESLEYNSDTQTFFTVSASEGPKVLYQINSQGTQTTALSEAYDDYLITGIALSEDQQFLYLVTEEWEDETDTLFAGLLVKVDLSNNQEVARYSLAIDVDGELQGIPAPSDVAIDDVNERIYITSDVDDSSLFVLAQF